LEGSSHCTWSLSLSLALSPLSLLPLSHFSRLTIEMWNLSYDDRSYTQWRDIWPYSLSLSFNDVHFLFLCTAWLKQSSLCFSVSWPVGLIAPLPGT
jgi:hypothetical protein